MVSGSRSGGFKPYSVQIRKETDGTYPYVGTPSFLIDSGGTWWASCVRYSGTLTTDANMFVYSSTDSGATWTLINTLTNCYWGRLFEQGGNLYAIGCSARYGDLVLKYTSNDWSTYDTVTLDSTTNWATSHLNIVEQDGFVLMAAFDLASTPLTSSKLYRLRLVYGDTTDLTSAGNWGKSDALAYSDGWNDVNWSANSGWLEPQLVSDSGTLKILARHTNGYEHKACYVTVTWTPGTPSATLAFDDTTGFIDLPGGGVQFSLAYHSGTSKWYALTNHVTSLAGDPNVQRNELWLCSSSTLNSGWSATKQILNANAFPRHRTLAYDGFQYVAMQEHPTNGALYYTMRTAFADAANYHDANRLTLGYIANYADLL